VLWEADGMPFDGVPFVVVGRLHMECRAGPKHIKKSKKGTVSYARC